jgi:cell wall-associated NlpC family hydrolase
VNRKAAGSAGAGVALILLLFFLTIPMLMVGGTSLLFGGNGGAGNCSGSANQAPVAQPGVSSQGKNSVPSNYLAIYQKVGLQYNIPWTILAGIGTEESNNGQSNLPGVHSLQNGFGAAGPMQIGISGASSNTWGGAPVHPASEKVAGVATDGNGDGVANVYDPADAIPGAAKYLVEHGAPGNMAGAIFAYNHAGWYVTAVENFATQYATGGFTVSQVNPGPAASTTGCNPGNSVLAALTTPNAAVASAINFAQGQIGKPYLWGGTGPDAFDCSGLVMMAYRAAGVVDIPRTAAEQFHWGPAVPVNAVSPGDLVFFAGADGTAANPGHVGLVIGKNTMIEAYATGFPLRISQFGTPASAGGEGPGKVVGFTRPWAHAGVNVSGTAPGSGTTIALPGASGSAGATASPPGSPVSPAKSTPAAPGGPPATKKP